VDLGRLVILVVKKEVLPSQVEAFTLTTIALIAVSFISNLSHLGSLPRRILLVKGVTYNIFNLFLLSYNPI